MEHEHKIELKFGYKDREGVIHKDVVFGKRLTGEDLFLIDNDRQAQSRTQYVELIRRKAITKFGDIRMPTPLEVLLKLNRIDRAIISEAFEDFSQICREGRTGEFRAGNITKLIYGFHVEGMDYPIVEFNGQPTGMDAVTADALGLEGLIRVCFLAGRAISRICTEDEKLSIEGPIDLELMRALDAGDIDMVQRGDQMAQVFFRIAGEGVSEERTGDDIAPIDEGNEPVGDGTVEPAEA